MSRPWAVIHSFGERLEWSGDLSDEPAWVDFYRGLWPDMVAATRVDADGDYQRRGVDRIVTRKIGRQHFIDEKKRDKDYGDFLCEVWSVCEVQHGRVRGEKIGWTLDDAKWCDFVAYAVLPARRCWLLPFELLRLACQRNVRAWCHAPGAWPKLAHNRGYLTANVAVPWDELFRAIRAESERDYGSALVLPAPEVAGNQVAFGWDAK